MAKRLSTTPTASKLFALVLKRYEGSTPKYGTKMPYGIRQHYTKIANN